MHIDLARAWRAMAVATLSAVVVVTGACTGDGEPRPTFSFSDASTSTGAGGGSVSSGAATSSTGSSPTSTAPFVPVRVTEPDPIPVAEQTSESAVAFLQWWVEVLNYAELTGDVELLRANSAPECVFCASRIASIEETYTTGDRFERNGDAALSKVQAGPVDLNAYVVIDFWVNTPAGRRVRQSGDVINEFGAIPPAPFAAGLQWQDGGWRIFGIAGREAG